MMGGGSIKEISVPDWRFEIENLDIVTQIMDKTQFEYISTPSVRFSFRKLY